MEKVSYSVSGISNRVQSLHLKKGLDKIQGIQEVEVDLTEGRVTIEYNAPADERQIIQEIESNGFNVE